MKTENTFIVHPETVEQENALKAFIKALKMKFEVSSNYNPEFVSKIKESSAQAKAGKVTRVPKEKLHEFLGVDE